MSVRLRLKRIGMPKQPYYRLVAIDRRSARNGKELEVLGHYDPRSKKDGFVAKFERVKYWLSCGAQPSDTIRSLLKRAGFFSPLAHSKESVGRQESTPEPSSASPKAREETSSAPA